MVVTFVWLLCGDPGLRGHAEAAPQSSDGRWQGRAGIKAVVVTFVWLLCGDLGLRGHAEAAQQRRDGRHYRAKREWQALQSGGRMVGSTAPQRSDGRLCGRSAMGGGIVEKQG